MNAFVIAGLVLLLGVIAVYVIATRREIAKLPPLDKKPVESKPKKVGT